MSKLLSRHNTVCTVCGSMPVRNPVYDAYFCPQCNIWLEAICDDKHCMYCLNRPNKPIKEEDVDTSIL